MVEQASGQVAGKKKRAGRVAKTPRAFPSSVTVIAIPKVWPEGLARRVWKSEEFDQNL
jgi:hypothetical protein